MKIKKLHAEILFATIKGAEGILSLADSRIRDAFLKDFVEDVKTYLNDKSGIYQTFCKKDEDGNPALVDGDKYEFEKKDLEEINKELLILSEEEIDVPACDKLKEFIEKSEYKPKVGEAEIIDEILAKL